jgi:ubiquinone/menaquinone biosynthesis C-methylase UbiE
MEHFATDKRTALESKEYAQWIAFAPMVFQAARSLRDLGILQQIREAGAAGADFGQLKPGSGLTEYGLRVLLEAGLGAGLLLLNNGRYTLTGTGVFILSDRLTNVNMDFTQDVCYEGMSTLTESIKTGRPKGLKFFGDWDTIYEGLSALPEHAKKSWFDFDHFYSDSAFESALSEVFAENPRQLLDIGGNTGKWAINCLRRNEQAVVTILDLPGQTAVARKNVEEAGFGSRINFIEANILRDEITFSQKFDVVWMSQFLDCFSDEQVVSILTRVKNGLNDNGYIYILETFWDRQRFKASAFCLQMTSLYFTTMANGNSQMYDSAVFFRLIEQSGLKIVEIKDDLGVSHTLLKCKIK